MVIGLVTVFDAILTSRQAGEKLQCLYQNALKKKIYTNCKLKLHS